MTHGNKISDDISTLHRLIDEAVTDPDSTAAYKKAALVSRQITHAVREARGDSPNSTRPHKLTVMLTTNEMDAIKAAADSQGLDVSNKVRQWIRTIGGAQ